MPFASVQHAQDFLTQNPDIELFELFILDANGVPRGKLLHREELLAVYQSGRPLPSTILGLSINGDDVEDSGLVCKSACPRARACRPRSPIRGIC